MQKHYSLKDFVNLINQHIIELRNIESENGKLSHILLLEIFVGSDKAIAKRFSYVIGSMQGSQDLQFKMMLDRLERSGKLTIVKELKNRMNLPCIDIQECIFLFNKKSNRDRGRNYNYSDYYLFTKKQFISGTATNFTIDWTLLTDVTNIPIDDPPITNKKPQTLSENTNINTIASDNEITNQVEKYEKAFDLATFKKIISRYKDTIELKPSGWWQTASSQKLWDEFCMQVMVIQATKSGREILYRNSGSWNQLSLEKAKLFRHKQDQIGLREYFETELRKNGMRMAMKKANTLCSSVFNPRILNENLDFVLVKQIDQLWKRDIPIRQIYNNEVRARDIIKSIVYGFGDKSASDFLLEIGFADYLIAFDVRVLSILRKLGLHWLKQDEIQNDPSQYKKLQNFIFKVCENIKITLRTIDRIFYQKKDDILSSL